MKQKFRILVALFVIIVLAGAVFAVEAWRGTKLESSLKPGDVPIYLDGKIIAGFTATDLENFQQVSFIDDEEGKTQKGWLLREILSQYVEPDQFRDNFIINIISSSREKEFNLTWAEVNDKENMVMFDLSGRGTLKLVSKLPQLDVRDEWVQDVDKIEIITP